MSNWKTVRISEFCRTGTGGTPSRSNLERYYEGGTIPWVKSGELRETVINKTEEHVTEAALQETNVKLVPAGALLLAMYGATVGRLGILGVEATTNQAVCHIIPDPKAAAVRFLFYALCNQVPNLIARGVGGAQPNISQGIVRDLMLALPPLAEQRRIAEVLDQAELLRTKRRAALSQLDTLTQAIFVHLYGDPVLNLKGLPTATLSEVCKRVTDGTHQPPKWALDGIPFLFISNIVDGQIDFQTHKFISDQTHQELTRRCPIETGDVLYTTVGSYGNAAVVTTTRKFAFQRHIAHIKPDIARIDSFFLAAMIQSPGVRRQVDKVARGVAQKTVNLSALKDLVIFCPPLTVQHEFTRRVAAVEDLKSAHRVSLTELDALFASLQHRAFRGEL
ncbi:MAG: restriction endonuclease subunit S [Betaproteobacteria bacterium]|nr:restriction endonuclease subunit S [Betaproteobacteria bacterium]